MLHSTFYGFTTYILYSSNRIHSLRMLGQQLFSNPGMGQTPFYFVGQCQDFQSTVIPNRVFECFSDIVVQILSNINSKYSFETGVWSLQVQVSPENRLFPPRPLALRSSSPPHKSLGRGRGRLGGQKGRNERFQWRRRRGRGRRRGPGAGCLTRRSSCRRGSRWRASASRWCRTSPWTTSSGGSD